MGVAAVCTLAQVGCATAPPNALPTPSHRLISISLPPGDGAVAGGILRCYALAWPSSPQFQAGTVDVYAGGFISANQAVLTSETLSAGTEYTFVLKPGIYVIVGDDPQSNLEQPMDQVTVTSGEIVTQDLQYSGCI